MKYILPFILGVGVVALVAQDVVRKPGDLGFKDTPMLPGGKWHVHDSDRPRPRQITPGAKLGDAPSDAEILFDGKDLSKWMQYGKGADKDKIVDPQWKIVDGELVIAPGTGFLLTRAKYGDCQLHIEWAAPKDVKGTSQARGNSGVFLMNRYELQVLDSYNDLTYADGGAGAIYGQFPPPVTPIRKTGEFNSYDIIFEAPKFENGKLVKPAYQTLLFNGVAVHWHKELLGKMTYRQVGYYEPHGDEEPISLQDHSNAVRFRNIWVRRLKLAE